MSDKMNIVKGTKGMMIPESSDRILPSFSLTEKDLPEIKKWMVGGKYKLEIEVEQIASEKSEYMTGQPLTSRFRIQKVKDISLSEDEKKARKGY